MEMLFDGLMCLHILHVSWFPGICQIKQNAFLRYQLQVMQQNHNNTAVVSYESLQTLETFLQEEARVHLDTKHAVYE